MTFAPNLKAAALAGAFALAFAGTAGAAMDRGEVKAEKAASRTSTSRPRLRARA